MLASKVPTDQYYRLVSVSLTNVVFCFVYFHIRLVLLWLQQAYWFFMHMYRALFGIILLSMCVEFFQV